MDPSRIHVIRSAVDPIDAKGENIREGFGIEPDEVLVTCVARLVELKGHDDLIRAGTGFRLLFVGDGPYGPRLAGRGAILAGERRDVPEILAASDIAVLASRFGEGCPNAVLEAMAASKPVVAARSGGTPEVVADGETGILVPPRDVPALRGALEKLAADPDLRKKMGRAGRERAEREFSVDKMVKLYEALYFKLTGAASPL
jgi:glycosyltransferase involved in cell wall biosynthesis